MRSNPANFGNLTKWMVSSFLLLLDIPSSSAKPTYEWRDRQTDERLVCQQCPPGTFVAQHCSRNSLTLCKPCPSPYYTQYWNYLESCLYCNVVCDRLEVEVQPCNGTHNRVCQCKPGYYSDSDFCLRHSTCPMGAEVARPGSAHEDTKCADCAPGTFSSTSSDPCQPHRNCSKEGLEVNVPGNQFHDTLCTSCNLGRVNASEGSAVGSGNEDCQKAMVDFVPYQVKSRRKLLRLMRHLGMGSSLHPRKSGLRLQAELHTYLTQLQNSLGEEHFIKKLLLLLQHLKLTQILHEIPKRFHPLR